MPEHLERRARIVFVAVHARPGPEAIPLAAACIAAAVSSDPALSGKFEPRILEAFSGDDPARLAASILDLRPVAVGFSLYAWNRMLCTAAARIVREREPGLALLAGGPDAEALAAKPGNAQPGPGLLFDAIFLGEGEVSLPAWLRSHDLRDPAWKRPSTPEIIRCAVPPMADIPSPWLAGTIQPGAATGPINDEAGAEGTALWELTRGCPFKCAYCYEGRGSRAVRHFHDDRIAAELDLFVAAGVRRVFVLDPTFNVDRARARRLLDLFARKAPGIAFYIEVRAELLDSAQAKAFGRIDCSLQIGLQSAEPGVLDRIRRTLDRATFADRLALLDAEGVRFGLDLIYGLPGDTLAGFRRSLDYALSLRPNHLDIFPLALLPGTEVAERAGEWRVDGMPDPPYLVLGQPGFGREDMAAAAGFAAACDLFYTHGRAVPWFAPVAQALRVRPSALLDGFPVPAGADALGHAAIESLQLEWIERLARARSKSDLLPAIRDLVSFNGAWSRAFAEGEETRLDLSYPPDLVAGPEILDLPEFARSRRRSPCRVRVFPSAGGPRVGKIGKSA